MLRIRRKLDSENLHLPELKPMFDRTVKIATRLVGARYSCYDVEKEPPP